MAVQKSKKSRSRRGTRRSHHALRPQELSTESHTGELHRRHHVSAEGFYKGVLRVFRPVKKDVDEDLEEQN